MPAGKAIKIVEGPTEAPFETIAAFRDPSMPSIVTLTMNPALDIATETESIVPTEKLRCAEPRYDPGGGGINVARAVHRLGGATIAVFPVGGLSGQMLCRLIGGEGVASAAVPIDGITRESFAVVERDSGKQYRFLLPGPHVSAHDQARCLDELTAQAVGADYIIASGSLPPGSPADLYARAADIARARDARFVLDTSGPALSGAGKGVFLIKTSLSELEQLNGAAIRSEPDQERAARAVIERGCAEILVLSLGGQGALLATRDATRRFPAIPVPAQSSIGAGDSMVAGMILSLTRGGTLTEAVRFGMAAGAAALLSPGTELCRREDAERLYQMAPGA
jgi:6-phosphofructokinase 2